VSAAPTLEQLEGMSDDELRATYNAMTQNVSVGLEWYREEFTRRRAERQAERLIVITWIIAILTAVNVVAVLAGVLA
jgi:hypothetical protein